MAEEEERRLVMTGSGYLDRFIVDTDRLSASTNKHNVDKLTTYKKEGCAYRERER